MDEATDTSFKPTYMSFATFWNYIEELASRPLPPQIDRSMMNSKSGTDQANLVGTLASFGLIGPEQRVEPALQALAVQDKERRAQELGSLVVRFYPDALAVSRQNGTEQQLHESFKENFGLDSADTRRKAITFFLHAARTAGIELSPHFPATRSGSGSPGVPRPKKAPKRKGTTPAGPATPAPDTAAQPPEGGVYSTEVAIDGAGTVTLTVNVNPLQLTGADRAFFFKLVDEMNDYATSNKTPPVDDEGGADSSETVGGSL